MRITKASVAVTVAVVIAVIGLAVVFTWAVVLDLHLPPSDDGMLRRFHQRQTEFTTLLAMAQADKGLEARYQAWVANWADLDPEDVGGPALQRYAQLREDLGVVSVRNGGNELVLITSSYSRSGTPWEKGYAYSAQTPATVVDKITSDATGAVYRPIGGGWYLFYESKGALSGRSKGGRV